MSDTPPRPSIPRLVVITPVYNEEAGLPAYERAVADILFARDDIDVQVLLVDDGSTDGSWAAIRGICARSARFRGVRLSRNFGPHVAISAGVDRADGDAVAVLACDLQDPPETVLDFVAAWRRGADIVWGARRTRQDQRWRIWLSEAFFRAVRRWAMPRGSKFTTGSFLLMDRKVAECFRRFREHGRVTFALVAWTGFDQDVVHYDRRARAAGASGWSPGRLLRAAYDTFIGFSEAPARVITALGVSVFLLSVLFIVYLVATWLFSQVAPGWTGIMVTVTSFFGLLFMMVGVIAEYLQRIFTETTGRPLYFVSRDTGADDDER
jgi:glycosyltransferase involved in cell wall biosynthesis